MMASSTQGVELIDQLFWKLLGSVDLLMKARRAGIHILLEPETQAFLVKRYGEKAEEVIAAITRDEAIACPQCGAPMLVRSEEG